MILRLFLNKWKHFNCRLKDRKTIFSDIYRGRKFGGDESVSGPGSSLKQTQVAREELPKVIKQFNIRTVIDAPCGDLHWMKEVALDIDKYIGLDIVPEIIHSNQREYGNEKREFLAIDIVKDRLPAGDLILCRDCFIHLSFRDIFSALRNFCRSGSKYLLTTTFTGLKENTDIVSGRVRPINLQKPPFNFPMPILLINEQCTEDEGRFVDKSLGLWEIEELKRIL